MAKTCHNYFGMFSYDLQNGLNIRNRYPSIRNGSLPIRNRTLPIPNGPTTGPKPASSGHTNCQKKATQQIRRCLVICLVIFMENMFK